MKAASLGRMGAVCIVTAWFACGGTELDESSAVDSIYQESAVGPHHPDFARKLRDIDGYVLDEDRLRSGTAESICGTRDLQHVNSYNGRLGVSQTYVKKYKGAVGAMTSKNTPTGSKYCTGTLIGKDLFLTASHCVSAKTVGHYIALGYERKPGSTTVGTQEFFKITQLVEEGAKKGIDYAIVRLERDAGSKYGITKMRPQDPKKDATLAIIQHPSGEPKQIEAGKHQGISGNYLRYADIDTLPGSSGSGVLDADGMLVGVHTNGGCTSGTSGANSGVRLSQAAKVSSIIR